MTWHVMPASVFTGLHVNKLIREFRVDDPCFFFFLHLFEKYFRDLNDAFKKITSYKNKYFQLRVCTNMHCFMIIMSSMTKKTRARWMISLCVSRFLIDCLVYFAEISAGENNQDSILQWIVLSDSVR
jgi:hypothetical protein